MHCKHFEGQQVSIYTKLHFRCPFSFRLYPIINIMPGSLGTGLFPVISMSKSDPQKWECILLSTCLITWGMYQRIADRCRINSYLLSPELHLIGWCQSPLDELPCQNEQGNDFSKQNQSDWCWPKQHQIFSFFVQTMHDYEHWSMRSKCNLQRPS